MDYKRILKNGLTNGARVSWELARIVIPLSIIISLLRIGGYVQELSKYVSPYMEFFGLPGEAWGMPSM